MIKGSVGPQESQDKLKFERKESMLQKERRWDRLCPVNASFLTVDRFQGIKRDWVKIQFLWLYSP